MTSVSYDEARMPSFTATLSARYNGVGPQDQIVASLWKGRAKVANCDGGVPAPLPAGSYRCERNQLPSGAYEFHVGFPGRRVSTYRFNLVSRKISRTARRSLSASFANCGSVSFPVRMSYNRWSKVSRMTAGI